MAGKPQYYVSDDGDVVAEVKSKPVEVRADFAELLDRLIANPHDARAGVREVKDRRPRAYTAPFDSALLMYSVTADYPCIRLLLVRWVADVEQR